MENLNSNSENAAITLEQLAEKLGGKLWIKGELKRIYLDRGYNTKKMSTKTYVFQKEDGSFAVSCYIDCPSQDFNWIKSQQQQVIDSVEESIERAQWEIDNPESNYDAHIEAQAQLIEEKKEEIRRSQWEIEAPAFNEKMATYAAIQDEFVNDVKLAYESLTDHEKIFVKQHLKGKNTVKPLMEFFRSKGFQLKTSVVQKFDF